MIINAIIIAIVISIAFIFYLVNIFVFKYTLTNISLI